jgi:hypothetical protein
MVFVSLGFDVVGRVACLLESEHYFILVSNTVEEQCSFPDYCSYSSVQYDILNFACRLDVGRLATKNRIEF